MYIIMWEKRACFGPFSSTITAKQWAERVFNKKWEELEGFQIFPVSMPATDSQATLYK
jgi:hypothetical protein